MTPKGKKTTIIVVSLLALGGIVGYVLWKRKKDKSASGETQVTDDSLTKETVTTDTTNTPKTVNTPSGTTTGGSGMPSTPSEIQKFQDWLDAKGLAWVGATNSALTNGKKLNKGGGYGNFGGSTQKGWAIYGAEYLKLSAPKATPVTSTGSGFRKGDSLYPKDNFDNAYNYPSKDKRYVVGRVVRNGASLIGKVVGDSNTKGWIKAKALVTGYKFNELTKTFDSTVKDVFLEAKNYTSVAP